MLSNFVEIPEILVVEDNRADRLLILEAMAESSVQHQVHSVEDGEAAMDFLKNCKHGAFCPNLILLDLNLPKKSGYELLQEIKADPKLKKIPIVILTSSASPQDIDYCYRYGASAYVVKGFGLDDFMAVVKNIEKFWLSVVRLPKKQKIEDELDD